MSECVCVEEKRENEKDQTMCIYIHVAVELEPPRRLYIFRWYCFRFSFSSDSLMLNCIFNLIVKIYYMDECVCFFLLNFYMCIVWLCFPSDFQSLFFLLWSFHDVCYNFLIKWVYRRTIALLTNVRSCFIPTTTIVFGRPKRQSNPF